MKNKKLAYYVLMFLPLVVVLIALPFLPDKIPAHFGFDNQVTRWGSKYETLLFPGATILMGLFLRAMGRFAAKEEKTGKNNEKVIFITGILVLLMFNILNIYMLYVDFKGIEDLSSVPIDLNKILFSLLGILMIVIGNVMPKLRMNSVAGLRTVWSLKNETTWKKSQRFGGISFIFAGIAVVVISIFTEGWVCFGWSMGILLVTLGIDVIYSYQIAKEY